MGLVNEDLKYFIDLELDVLVWSISLSIIVF